MKMKVPKLSAIAVAIVALIYFGIDELGEHDPIGAAIALGFALAFMVLVVVATRGNRHGKV